MPQWKPVWPSCRVWTWLSSQSANIDAFGDEPQHRPGKNVKRRRRMVTLNSWCHSDWLCWAPPELPVCFSDRYGWDKIVSGLWSPSHEGWHATRDTARIASSANPTKAGLDWIGFKTFGKLQCVWSYSTFWSDNDEGTNWGRDGVARCDFNFWGAWENRT